MREYMANVTKVLEQILKLDGLDPDYQAGRMAMGLEVVSVLRTLEEIPVVMTPDQTAVVQSVLETLLVQQGLTGAFEMYDRLSAARRVVFVPEPLLPRSVASVDDELRDLASESDDYASPDARHLRVIAPQETLRSLAEARRNRDAETNDESTVLRDEASETTPSE